MSAGAFALGMSSCENSDISFPDSDAGVQVYFAYQHPIRTIVLGDLAAYDNTRENVDHAFTIYGVSSGSYTGKDIDVEVAVDETLLKGLTFEDGTPVQLMPSNYYQLSGSTLHYGGNFRGGVDVTLSDEFFKDPASVGNTYVIPMVMKSATGEVDGILKGTASIDGALRQDETKWTVAPKDYTLFLVNYINEYDGNYLRRGSNKTHVYGKPEMGPVSITTGDKGEGGADWDNQFWIVSDIKFEEGQQWTLKMKIKADKATEHGTQTHFLKDDGDYDYKDWRGMAFGGKVPFTTDWAEYTAEGTFPADVNEKDGKSNGCAFAFNLNDGDGEGNTYYFDDIELIIDGKYGVKENEAGKYVIKTNIGDKKDIQIKNDYSTELVDKTYDESRHEEFVEKDEVIKLTTTSRLGVQMPVSVPTVDGPVKCTLQLDFNGQNNCSISSATDGFTVTGTGEFKSKSEKLAWGNKDRDGLYLNYTIEYGDNKYQATDTLVVRDRGSVTQIREFKTTYTEE